MECVRLDAPNKGFFMRLFDFLNMHSRGRYIVLLFVLFIGCGGSGGPSPILGTPSVQNTSDLTPNDSLPIVTPIVTPPIVISTVPLKAIPIATDISINSILSANFSHDMNSASLTPSNFSVACPTGTPITGTVTYDNANRLAVLHHAAPLPAGTTCTATITTAVVDTALTALATNYVWTFTTAATPTVPVPADPPTVIASYPLDNALLICRTQNLSVTFSKAMDPTTINSTTLSITNAGVVIPGLIAYDSSSNTATFSVTQNSPNFGYADNSAFLTTISTGVTDVSGTAMVAAKILHFTTGSNSCVPELTVNLGSIASYGAFGGNAGITNSGTNTVVNGDLGTTAKCSLFTGFHDAINTYTETPLNIGQVTGTIFCGPPAPGTVQSLALTTLAATDALTAYNALQGLAPTVTLATGELGGLTLTKGVYLTPVSTLIIGSGDLTLDASGDPGAVWVFQMPTSLTVGLIGTPRNVILINGAQAKNVYWQVGSAARLENASVLVGTVIAKAGMTISTAGQLIQTVLTGRAIGLDASVTMVNTTIYAP